MLIRINILFQNSGLKFKIIDMIDNILKYIVNGILRRVHFYKNVFRARIISIFYRNVKIGKNTCIEKGVKFSTLNGGVITIGENCVIKNGVCFITEGGNISIGNNCSFNPYAMIYGQGGLKIGNGVRVATHAVIIPSNHIFSDKTKFIYEQGLTKFGISINDNVWIGASAVILDNVSIGFGTVVAAGSVVTKNTEEFSVYAGIPAKQIKKY